MADTCWLRACHAAQVLLRWSTPAALLGTVLTRHTLPCLRLHSLSELSAHSAFPPFLPQYISKLLDRYDNNLYCDDAFRSIAYSELQGCIRKPVSSWAAERRHLSVHVCVCVCSGERKLTDAWCG